MSKDISKSKDKKQKSKTTSNGRFQLLTDFKPGDNFPDTPGQFSSDFRLLRQMVRWAKRYGVLREGRLHIYGSRLDMERNHVWRTVDLARSVVSYRNSDRKLILNTIEPSSEIFRIKADDQVKFKQWVNQLRVHRQYGQAKLAPVTKVIVAKPPPPEPTPAPITGISREEAMGIIANLDAVLDKLEANLSSEMSTSNSVRNHQIEFVAMAKEAQSKFRALFGITEDRNHIKTWQPTAKPKVQVPPKQPTPTPVPTAPSRPSAPQEKSKLTIAAALVPSSVTPLSKQTPKPAVVEKKLTISPPPPSPSHSDQPKLEIKVSEAVPTPSPSPSSGALSGATSTTRESPVTGRTTPTSTEAEEVASVEEQKIDDVPDTDGEASISEKEEAPSPAKVPVYRLKLPAVMGPQPSVFKIAMAAIGRDVMQFSLPAAIMEPLSMLQVMCEELEYSELIDQAVATPEPHLRMAYVACFACSRYGSTAYRSGRKPFNPLLGQTFEFDSPHLGWRFVGEQVQHHPSVSAGCAEGRGWQWWQDCELMVTYGGNSMEIKPVGFVHLHLEKWGEIYNWTKCLSSVSGLLSGTYVLDHYGDITVQCAKSHLTAKMTFRKATKAMRGEIDGKIMDQKGQVLETVYGSWCDSLYVGPATDTKGHCVWRLAALPPDSAKYYGLTRFAMSLNEFRPDIHGLLPKTDSRYRPDQRALEMGRPADADKIKKDLEGRQRQRRKDVEAGKRQAHKPLWFQPTANKDPMKGARWQFNGKYWKSKESEFKGVAFLPLW